jgi:hypothetical protein
MKRVSIFVESFISLVPLIVGCGRTENSSGQCSIHVRWWERLKNFLPSVRIGLKCFIYDMVSNILFLTHNYREVICSDSKLLSVAISEPLQMSRY